MKLKSIYGSIPIVMAGIGIFIDYWDCQILHTSLLLILFILTGFYLTAFYVINLVLYFYRGSTIDVKPLFFSVTLVLIIYFLDSKKEGRPILRAESGERKFGLTMRGDSHLDVYYGSIHRICKCSGSYSKIGDTIFVEGISKSIPRVSNKYLLTRRHVIPIKESKIEMDSSKYLTIFENEIGDSEK